VAESNTLPEILPPGKLPCLCCEKEIKDKKVTRINILMKNFIV